MLDYGIKFAGPEFDWMRSPITREELEALKKGSKGHMIAGRQGPKEQYVWQDLLQVLLDDYEQLRFRQSD